MSQPGNVSEVRKLNFHWDKRRLDRMELRRVELEDGLDGLLAQIDLIKAAIRLAEMDGVGDE